MSKPTFDLPLQSDEAPIDTSQDTPLRAKFTEQGPLKPSLVTKPQTSPLLSSTPPMVAKALVKAYPYLVIVNKVLAITTWTNDDYWINIVMLSLFSLFILYFENLIIWLGHIILVSFITLYAVLNNRIIESTINLNPTLDEVVAALTAACIKADMLLSPITSLALTAHDIKRLIFTTMFLTPIYLLITFLVIKPRTILLLSGLYVFTYHSSYSRITRRMIWKIKLTRVICFYLTGLDFNQAKNHSLFQAAMAKVNRTNISGDIDTNKPVRFTYVIYENQRRWLGIGWTSNLLSYERTAWTDEFLNELSSIDNFNLPNVDDPQMVGANWQWVDKTWRLDLTNDGAIVLPSSKRSKTTANPGPDEGFIYYDNTWRKPTTEDTFSKYTRRRRWIRTAELVFDKPPVVDVSTTTGSSVSATAAKKRKSLRFSENSIVENEGNVARPVLDDVSTED